MAQPGRVRLGKQRAHSRWVAGQDSSKVKQAEPPAHLARSGDGCTCEARRSLADVRPGRRLLLEERMEAGLLASRPLAVRVGRPAGRGALWAGGAEVADWPASSRRTCGA